MPAVQSDILVTRPFEAGDLSRLIAWAGMEKPAFLRGSDFMQAAKDFLAEAQAHDYQAVCYAGTQSNRVAGRVYAGPLGCLFNGGVFVESGLRTDPVVEAEIAKFSTPPVRRLKVA